ncbi:hypothetical protein KUV59_03385 [Marinobacter daepoensis]|uniref:hypothetical protein n=1 Tax=Marinobacter daepoensis TaxID=262077 RepID=UPI001C975ADE|nr:hypothetical protein [Marinobacter daepoensis]MBY6032197.1 hypothetical protein [Marinobacter daepoensis]
MALNIDLSAVGAAEPLPDPADIDLRTANNEAVLTFSAVGVGRLPARGDGAAVLGFHALGEGLRIVPGAGVANLTLEASGVGSSGVYRASGAVGLGIAASGAGYQDWVAILPPVQLQEVYRLVITGAQDGQPDLAIGGISSWQATNQAGVRSSYVQAVIPAADRYLAEIDARKNGELVIEKGYRLAGGLTRHEEILRAKFDMARPDQGRRSLTLTVSGYMRGKPLSSGSRKLTGIRMISKPNGKRRVTCDIDLFLQPGMTVAALNETFRADYINYYVTQSDKFCEVGER